MTTKKKFWWIDGASFQKLREDMIEAGEVGRLEVHPDGDKLNFKVVSPTYDGPFVNESRVCPPICP